MKRSLSFCLMASSATVAISLSLSSTATGVIHTTETESWTDLSPNFSSTGFPSGGGSLVPLVFDMFDPTLGTLLSVEVQTYIAFDQGIAQVDSEAVQPTNINIEFGTNADFTPNAGDGVVFLDSSYQTIGDNLTASVSQGYTNVGANDGDDPLSFQDDNGADNQDLFGPASGAPVSDIDRGFIHSTLIGNFIGPGTFRVEYAADTRFNISSSGSFSGAFTPGLTNGEVSVTYGYEPIPEPAAPLLLFSAGFIALLRRRRRSR